MQGSIQALYRDHVNPHLATMLAALKLDKHYQRGEGVYLFDEQHRRYVDFVAGFGALPFGHNPTAIHQAAAQFLNNEQPNLIQPSSLEAAAVLAQRLSELAPEGLRYVWMTNSGAESVEAAIKACRAAKHRPGVIYAESSFHGKTLGALSATGADKYQQPFFAEKNHFHAVPYGDIEAIRQCLEQHSKQVACVILEPIQGEGGVVLPPEGYLTAVRALCDEFDVLLVLDEVQTGLGRTGTLFACEYENVIPDALTLSKALSGGLVPIGCCLLNENSFSEDLGLYHSSTFAGNSFACHVALAAIEHLLEPSQNYLNNIRDRSQQLRQGLERLAEQYPHIVRSVRGRGLMLGVALQFQRASQLQSFGAVLETLSIQGSLIPVISSYLLNVHGVRTAPTLTAGHVLRIQPPLSISEQDCQLFLDALEQALHLLARGDTGSLIEHLILDDHEQAQPQAIATPDESLREGWPEAEPGDSRLAFLVHFMDERTLMEYDISLQRYSEPALQRVSKLAEQTMEPFVVSRTRVQSAGPEQRGVVCEFIALPKLPSEMRAMGPDEAEATVAEALQMAVDNGAELVGLGAYTSVVTQGGTKMTKYGVPVTTGNTYTVITAMQAVEDASSKVGIPLDQARVVIIGATGMIGSSLVDTYLGRCAHMTLVGNPARPESTWRRMTAHLAASLREEVLGDAQREAFFDQDKQAAAYFSCEDYDGLAQYLVRNEHSLPIHCGLSADEALVDADIVICATSSTEFLVDVRQLKHGAIILDLSQPSNVDKATLGARPDVLFIDGGVVAFPNRPDMNFNFGFPRGHGFACMAETMMLGLERHFQHCSIGARTNRKTRHWIAGLAEHHGFKLSGLRRFNRQMNDADWSSYINARSSDPDFPVGVPSGPSQASNGCGLAWVAVPPVRALKADDPANLCHWLVDRHLAEHGDASAVVCGDDSLSYRQLDRLSRLGAYRLQQAGVGTGDFVAILSQDTPAMVAGLLACWRLGAIAAPVNPGLPAQSHQQMLNTIKPSVVLLDDDHQAMAAGFTALGFNCLDLAACVALFDENEAAKSDIDVDALRHHDFAPQLQLDSPLVALFSSGSTGTPKPILHSHGDLLAMSTNYMPTVVQLQAGESVFSPSRMFFGYGLNSVVFALFAAGRAVLLGEVPKPKAILNALQQHDVNVLFSVPTILKLLFAHWPRQGLAFPHLRLCVSAGETLPASLYALALERFGVEIIDGIGTTEVLSTFISTRPGESRPNCTGLVVPGFEARLLNEQGETCAVGETGTLWVRGNTLTQGIYGDSVLTRQVFNDGWFNTKDMLFMDASGHFHYVGRANDVLKINGCWVAPHQIEAALLRHNDVCECAVVAVADEYGLLRPKAFVVSDLPERQHASLWQELKAFAKQHVGAHQYPHLFAAVDDLPRTASGKLQRHRLLEDQASPSLSTRLNEADAS